MSRWVIFLPISLLLSNHGCAPEASLNAASATSQHASSQFQIADLQIQEGPDENKVWEAVAAQAVGDLQQTQVAELTVTHKVQGGDNTVVLKAPSGTLSPLTDDAALTDATIQDSFDRSMKIPTLTYHRKSETIEGSGPIQIEGPGFSLTATELNYQLKDGKLVLGGPIQGAVSLAANRPQSAR